jgi:hypothetical protein
LKQATDLIMKLCIASGDENIAIDKKGDSVQLTEKHVSVEVKSDDQ